MIVPLSRESGGFHRRRENHAKALCGCCIMTTQRIIQVLFEVSEAYLRKFFL
jgi:hypothetical protein